MTIVLASTSSARKKLLTEAGVDFQTQAPPVDEAQIKAEYSVLQPKQLAIRLARAKAVSVSSVQLEALVVGADQVLEFAGKIWDKPTSEMQAKQQLSMLRGRSHILHSAICCARSGDVTWEFTGQATLTMRNFSEEFLDQYLGKVGSEVMNSVGGYQLEGLGIQLFESINGDYTAILGLPLLPLLDCLRRNGEIQA